MKILINGKSVDVNILDYRHDKVLFSVNNKTYLVEKESPELIHNKNSTSGKTAQKRKTSANKSARSGGTLATAPIPGVVSKISKTIGDHIESGETVMILEAMKMQNRVIAPCDGTVKNIFVSEGEEVSDGQELFEITS